MARDPKTEPGRDGASGGARPAWRDSAVLGWSASPGQRVTLTPEDLPPTCAASAGGARAEDGNLGTRTAQKGPSALPPRPQNVTVFGDGAMEEEIKVNEFIGEPDSEAHRCQEPRGGAHDCQDLAGGTYRCRTLWVDRTSAHALHPGPCGDTKLPGPGPWAHRCQDLRGAQSCQDLWGGAHRCQDLRGGAHRRQDPAPRARPRRWCRRRQGSRPRPGSALRPAFRPPRPSLPAPSPAPPPAALALPAGPAEAACALCQRAPREPVRADCGHRFCRACVVRFWAEEDGPFPCPECADDCWQRAVEPGRPPLSRRLLALEEAAAAPARDGPASEAALQLLCRADAGPLCAACRMAAGPEPPEWEPRWRKALRGKENKGSVEIMKKDLNDARDLHGQAESAAAVWKGHVMDRRKKALTDYKKLRAFFAEEEEHFLQEAEKEEGVPEDELADPAERFRSLLQAVSELERKHRNLGLSMLLQ
ncbi:E3 ubiquitin-protein ligase RNF187 [Eulemur rufifrons]|uniref:E3 ubiquitin-protein ligase RNF187 n=1 Tax=Eulemur rufifrons TaxID=859984 RepID=UPI0037440D99